MGISSEGIWIDAKNQSSRYLKFVSLDDDEEFHDFWLNDAKNPSIGKIIHEINECEIHDILMRWNFENTYIIPLKKESIKMLRYNEGVYISHIISPYGTVGCIMPRSRFKARW